MSSKDEKNLARVLDKISAMDEPRRYGMPALVTLRNDERLNLALTEKAPFRAAGSADAKLMPAAWYFESIDDDTAHRIAEIVRPVID